VRLAKPASIRRVCSAAVIANLPIGAAHTTGLPRTMVAQCRVGIVATLTRSVESAEARLHFSHALGHTASFHDGVKDPTGEKSRIATVAMRRVRKRKSTQLKHELYSVSDA